MTLNKQPNQQPEGPSKKPKSFVDRLNMAIDLAGTLISTRGRRHISPKEAAKEAAREAAREKAQESYNLVKRQLNDFIKPFLKAKNPSLTERQFWESDMIYREVVPILFSGYQVNQFYVFIPNKEGFTLDNDYPLWPVHYKLDDFDKKLNYKSSTGNTYEDESRKAAAEEAKQFKEDQKKYETEQEHIKLALTKYFSDETTVMEEQTDAFESDTLEQFKDKVNKSLESIADKIPALGEIHGDIINVIEDAKNDMWDNGTEPEAIKRLNSRMENLTAVKKFQEIRENAKADGDYKTLAACRLYGDFLENLMSKTQKEYKKGESENE
ncbi:hypothetical protein COY05_03755 [Candidatus Peregrinibacteria bacterium CG_4_10_14_0_2_um_filter_38_24]|nr:MAG: hypothetical protein COY05_03755 [Candidatus Peregrinibacteria bacterium CG_4_10_14_0_2_um_filter_38_24]PJC39060.1 MAG: hypothetical protein CO044_01735 [Candidatus Peregrinibacteria bacterium CG_4_9_14_0_2_um_filter_38_9]